MSSKYGGPFKKGMRVFLRSRDEANRGAIEEDQLYEIMSIGNKQAVLENILPGGKKGQDYFSPFHGKGSTFYLSTIEEARNRMAGGWARRAFYPTNWSQIFAMAGKNGWDPEENY